MIDIINFPTPSFGWWRVYRTDGTCRIISPGERADLLRKAKARKAAERAQGGGDGGAA